MHTILSRLYNGHLTVLSRLREQLQSLATFYIFIASFEYLFMKYRPNSDMS